MFFAGRLKSVWHFVLLSYVWQPRQVDFGSSVIKMNDLGTLTGHMMGNLNSESWFSKELLFISYNVLMDISL